MAEKISNALIGLESESIEILWTEKDVQLYAEVTRLSLHR